MITIKGILFFLQILKILKTKKRLNDLYVKHTGQPLDVIEKNMERDKFFTTQEALEFGLIDKIIEQRTE